MSELKVLVDAGNATPGPPLGPALGPLGIDVVKIIEDINKKTQPFSGVKVPVTITIDDKTKNYTIAVGTPPVSSLIIKELGLEKGSKNLQEKVKSNITIQQIIKIAKLKDSLLGKTLKERVLEVLGTAQSMFVDVDGKNPKEVQKEVLSGIYDKLFN